MKKQPKFCVNLITYLFVSCYSYVGYAATADTKKEELETIDVVTEKIKDRKDNEVTGLGKVVKTTETINREQVLNIRDLTRMIREFRWSSKVGVPLPVIPFAEWIVIEFH
ncbi:transferrin-binding protein [Aggregatibacter actinomycetemcomitans serotype d str. SA2200]|uniref:hypothetical protein n=1 Tax=Aggregatibacter actinomycetemcomitans TaxID=714 RepID=UPI00077E3CB6|nr:hypothetical protein [Aggregatibacter actinomycetemcomitans]KYK90239.1 transferrin-binding protein [Aggregatibacter actinomycetemcomitans serotype d str. SA2200]KYK94203.1 transferrin-binding protein [Aggregatibacter actinomycetemcomitans serotype d str. SA3733]